MKVDIHLAVLYLFNSNSSAANIVRMIFYRIFSPSWLQNPSILPIRQSCPTKKQPAGFSVQRAVN